MVLAYHVVFSTYGFWLPNDPRGSGSVYVGSNALLPFGLATKTDERNSVADRPHDRGVRRLARSALRRPPVRLSGGLAQAAARGFGRACAEGAYALHALALMPDHVHAVIGRHGRSIRAIVGHLKARATRGLKEEGQWQTDGPVWGEGCRVVFLDSDERVRGATEYVEANPVRAGLRPQHWSIVVPWRGAGRRQKAPAKAGGEIRV